MVSHTQPLPLYDYPDSFLKSLAYRENRTYRRSSFLTISGSGHRKTRIGKSWTAIKSGEYNDTDYRIEGSARKIVYNIADFMDIIDELEQDYIAAPRRTIAKTLIMDEAGSLIGSSQWQQATNKAVKYVVETCGYLRMNGILVMPQRRSIDKNVRTMADYHISMSITTNPNGKPLRKASLYSVDYDEWKDETYRRTMRGYGVKGMIRNQIMPLRNIPISPITNQELVENYKKKELAYKMKLRELMANDIRNYEKQLSKDPTLPQVEDIANKVANDEELISDIVTNRKTDSTLLAVTLEKNFPDYRFNSTSISTIKKIIDKLLIGKRTRGG